MHPKRERGMLLNVFFLDFFGLYASPELLKNLIHKKVKTYFHLFIFVKNSPVFRGYGS